MLDNPLYQLSSVALQQLSSLTSIPSHLISKPKRKHDTISSSILPEPVMVRSKTTGSITEPKPTYDDGRHWVNLVTKEDKDKVQQKIYEAYLHNDVNSFEELLDLCVEIEEEMLFASAPSRLDYYKEGVRYEGKIDDIQSKKAKKEIS